MKYLCLAKQCGLFGGGELAAVDGCDVCRMEATEGVVYGVFHLFGYWGVEIFLFVSGFGIVYSLYRNDVSLCDSIHVYLGMYRDLSLQKMQIASSIFICFPSYLAKSHFFKAIWRIIIIGKS